MPNMAKDSDRKWKVLWEWFAQVLADLGRVSDSDPWDPEALAVFVDVPSSEIAHMIPEARAAGLTEGLDLVERVRTGVKRAMARMRRARIPRADRPLPLEYGLTLVLLVWEWAEMEDAGEPAWDFFERLRELRLRIPEVSFCERTVHDFCRRVPPPRIG